MEQAIKRACESGYKPWYFKEDKAEIEFYYPKILLDRTFWQALGKAEGWTGLTEHNTEAERKMTFGEYTERNWKTKWHLFIDHLAEGNDAELFFNQLLK